MTKRFLGSVAVSAVMLVAAPVAAQKVSSSNFSRYYEVPPGGTASSNPASLSPADKARVTLNAYAACLATHDRAQVARYLATPPDSSAAAAASHGLAAAQCLRYGDLGYADEQLRGALYIALVRDGVARSAPATLSAVDYTTGAGAENADAAARAVALRQFADCVVRADPVASRNAVTSPVGSDAERAAYRALSPVYAGCMTQGSTARLNRTVLSGLLAETLYRASGAGAGR